MPPLCVCLSVCLSVFFPLFLSLSLSVSYLRLDTIGLDYDLLLYFFRHPGRAGVLESTTTAHVPVVHTVPQLKVSETEARRIASRDEGRLLQQRKLVLIVDLDQTLIHTTVDPSIEPGLKDVYGFQLPGYPHFYHCRLRPGAKDFVSNVSANYEMHVFTLGGRDYAHTVAGILDPDEKLFARRVLSRDELLDQNLKTSNLRL